MRFSRRMASFKKEGEPFKASGADAAGGAAKASLLNHGGSVAAEDAAIDGGGEAGGYPTTLHPKP